MGHVNIRTEGLYDDKTLAAAEEQTRESGKLSAVLVGESIKVRRDESSSFYRRRPLLAAAKNKRS